MIVRHVSLDPKKHPVNKIYKRVQISSTVVRNLLWNCQALFFGLSGTILLFFLLVHYRHQHTCTNFLAYKAIYAHLYMVSGAVQYCKAMLGCNNI